MNCCGGNHDHGNHNDGTHTEKKSRGISHLLMMILCCGLPILLLALVPLIGQLNGGIGAFIQKYSFFLCPVMMVGMMLMMHGDHHAKDEHESHEQTARRIEDAR